jgi:predicted alpha/beta hydrolase
MLKVEPHTISCADGHPLGLTLYRSSLATRGIVVIASAVGIPQGFYRDYASHLGENHLHAITFDYRGSGASASTPDRPPAKLQDWAIQDINAVLGFAKQIVAEQTEALPVYFLGHSIGGQIVGLASGSREFSRLVLISASFPYWKRWPFPDNLKVKLMEQVVIPLLAFGRRDFPTRMAGLGSITIPSECARQWADWMSEPDYLFSRKFKLDTSGYAALTQPVVAVGFDDDQLVPEASIDVLLAHLSSAKAKKIIIHAKDLAIGSIGHSGFFRKKSQTALWTQSLDWFSRHSI